MLNTSTTLIGKRCVIITTGEEGTFVGFGIGSSRKDGNPFTLCIVEIDCAMGTKLGTALIGEVVFPDPNKHEICKAVSKWNFKFWWKTKNA